MNGFGFTHCLIYGNNIIIILFFTPRFVMEDFFLLLFGDLVSLYDCFMISSGGRRQLEALQMDNKQNLIEKQLKKKLSVHKLLLLVKLPLVISELMVPLSTIYVLLW